MDRHAAITIDLDGMDNYHRIHGLKPLEGPDPIYSHGVPRFLEILRRHGLRATFFAVGADLKGGAGREMGQEILRCGHELANHTFHHRYDLIRLGRDDILKEIWDGHEAIAGLGAEPKGFRAPGYNISPLLLDILQELHYSYDSSVFPSLPYTAAKASVMAAMALLGKPSASILGDTAAALAPFVPYRPSLPHAYRPGGRGIVELPISTLPAGVPFIGTTLALLGRPFWYLGHEIMLRHRNYFNLELHGIDLIGGDDPVAPELRKLRLDLKVPLEKRMNLFDQAFSALARHWNVVTLIHLVGVYVGNPRWMG